MADPTPTPTAPDMQSYVNSLIASATANGGTNVGPSNVDTSGDWNAYWGYSRPSGGGEDARDRRAGIKSDQYKSATQMQAWLQEQWSKNARFRTIMNQYAVAIPGFGTGYKGVSQMWDAAGAYSAQLAAAGRKLTPMQVLQLWAGGKATGLPNSAIGGAGSGSTTHTSTNVSYDLSDPLTAKALTNAVLSSALGREATADELAMYRNALNSYEKSNPSTSTSTTTTDAQGNSSTSSTSKAGASQAGREQIIKDKAEGTAEGQAFRGSNLFEQAMQILASRVG